MYKQNLDLTSVKYDDAYLYKVLDSQVDQVLEILFKDKSSIKIY